MDSYNPFCLKDKTILVTGATGGIGRAVAVECSRMGATVIATGRNSERLAEIEDLLEGSKHLMVSLDITNDDQVAAAVKTLPPLDGVVHCAGILERVPAKMIRRGDIERIMGLNFDSTVLLQRALLKNKLINRRASIVFISSQAAKTPTPGQALYAASKAALEAYSKTLSLEVAKQGIRVNCVCPSMVWTQMTCTDADRSGVDYTEVEKYYPLGHFGQPEDIAHLVVYLMSDASAWMSGSCIDIDGGSK